MNLSGAHERFSCACCDRPFWSARADTHFVLCDSATRMPCNIGTPGAVLLPIGECCSEEVRDLIDSLPPTSSDDSLLWTL